MACLGSSFATMSEEIAAIARSVGHTVSDIEAAYLMEADRGRTPDSLDSDDGLQGSGAWREVAEKNRIIEDLKNRLKSACDSSILSIKEGARMVEERGAR